MHTLLAAAYFVACVMVSITCWSFLLAGRGDGWRAIVHGLGLLAIAVGSFTTAAATTVHGRLPSFWVVLMVLGAGVVAAGLYETRFGFKQQLRCLFAHYAETVGRVRLVLELLRSARNHRNPQR